MDKRHPSTYSTDELLKMAAEKRAKLIERVTILKQQLRQIVSELGVCERHIDELDRTETHLLAEKNVPRLRREK
jgi:hypothetical protein